MKRILGFTALVLIVLAFFLQRSLRREDSKLVQESQAEHAALASPIPAGSGAGANASVAPSGPTETSRHFASKEEFVSFTLETLNKLPKVADLQKLKPEEVHETPQVLREAGVQLGIIAQATKDDPSLGPEAFNFYEKCSKQDTLPSSIRALCYHRYEEWGNRLGSAWDRGIVPSDVRDLSSKIDGL